MTDLEYIICESERCGEIDLDTRDNLLSVLYEGSNAGIKEYKKELRSYNKISKNAHDKDGYDKKHKKFDDILAKTYDFKDPMTYKKRAQLNGNEASVWKKEIKKDDPLNKCKERKFHDSVNNGRSDAEKYKSRYHKDDRRAIDKRLDKYGTVESTEVDIDNIRMEIYERELTGEITVEEREQLLDYLDAKLEME